MLAAEAAVEEDSSRAILNWCRQFPIPERGLADVSADRYIDCLRPFLDCVMVAGDRDLRGLTPADVTSFVVVWCPCLNPGVTQLTVAALRSFLRFLHLDGVMERALVPALPKLSRG